MEMAALATSVQGHLLTSTRTCVSTCVYRLAPRLIHASTSVTPPSTATPPTRLPLELINYFINNYVMERGSRAALIRVKDEERLWHGKYQPASRLSLRATTTPP